MFYTAPVIEDIKIKGRAAHLCNELLAWESVRGAYVLYSAGYRRY
nr:MAG TPA: hypothetical protein [Caudoviricetes sp.]